MTRPLRIEYPGAFYHIMNRGQSGRKIFLEDQGRQSFLDLLADIARLWKVEIFAYCLMDNHYHLLLSTPAGVLSRPMRHLDGIYTQRFNRSIIVMDGFFAAGIKRFSLMPKSTFYRWCAIFIRTHWAPGSYQTQTGTVGAAIGDI